MSLQDLVKTGLDFSDHMAVDRALSTDAAVDAMLDHQEATRTRATPLELAQDETENDTTLETGEPATAAVEAPGEGEPPVPFGEEVAPTPAAELTPEQQAAATTAAAAAAKAAAPETDARVAELLAENERLKTENAELGQRAGDREQSAAAQERAAELAELIGELGEDHVMVKRARRENAEADAREARDATQDANNATAANVATHAKLVTAVPFLESFYKNDDGEGIAIAAAISKAILADPKLVGQPQSKSFTPEHYREVEARLLKRFPEARTKFYNVRQPTNRNTGKVTPITVSQLRGGTAPPAGTRATVDQASLYQEIVDNPNVPIDQILARRSQTG